MKNFDENFRFFSIAKIFGDRFQNALTFFIINRFGRDFFQSCVDFHGGHDGIGFRAPGVVPDRGRRFPNRDMVLDCSGQPIGLQWAPGLYRAPHSVS